MTRRDDRSKKKEKKYFLTSKSTSKICFEHTITASKPPYIPRARDQECSEIQLKKSKSGEQIFLVK